MRMLAFIDLDLTLFDYSAVREGATRVALEAMNTDCNIDDAIELMNSTLIPYGDLLVEANLPNFRKEWKAPELFALLSYVCRGLAIDPGTEKFKDFFSEIGQMPLPDQGTSFRKRSEDALLLKQSPYAAQVDAINKKLGELLRSTTYQAKIEDAIAAFNIYLRKEAIPSKGVAELLENLGARGFEVYVVSEGDENIQKEKVTALNLESQIDGLYVSSSCCQSQQLLDWLWQQAKSARDENRETETRAFAVLYDETLQYNTKSENFFRKVLHSVLAPRSDRANFYRRFGWLSKAACSIEEPVHIVLLGTGTTRIYSRVLKRFATSLPFGCLRENTRKPFNPITWSNRNFLNRQLPLLL